ncbi:hypothetical protein COV17_00675 [Candidatus Woesearchaeota archaeon CG10_big_fil_rev_8_21_14_0_10_36_11]|nr:MAG: hypothetical protein COV17_00675 [Candidatus Woesearchaeota archaeon CG10_big_fil_rev_8_21_14_0_10_36_11]
MVIFMVKENTHLLSAERVRYKIRPSRITKVISSNLSMYYLGSIIPDSGVYCCRKSVHDISYWLHGKKGNLTNKIIFTMLDKIKKTYNGKDLAFVFGYCTHCALDITFHPIIFYLSGNYCDSNVLKLRKAQYGHHYLETYLDNKFNKSFKIHKLINPKLLNDVSFVPALIECMDRKNINYTRALMNQLWFDKHAYSRVLFSFFSFFSSLRPIASMMYPVLQQDVKHFPKSIKYRDPITGTRKTATWNKLFDESFTLAEKMIVAADKYVHNEISKKQAQKIIDGKSLDTGKIGVPMSMIKFTV